MLIVQASPAGGQFIEFVRVDVLATDNGVIPIITGPFEIFYTTDGTLPEADINGNPLGTTKKRRAPIKNFPIDHPITLRFFAQTPDGMTVTAISSAFYDLVELTAVNEIHTAPPSVRNYTLAVVNGDIVKSDNGLLEIVSGVNKSRQDIREIILVENVAPGAPIGSRTLPNFGSALNRLLGQALPAGFARGQVQTTILEALTFLIDIQREESVPSDEQINKVLFVNVKTLSPTSYQYSFSVETVSGSQFSDTGVVGG